MTHRPFLPMAILGLFCAALAQAEVEEMDSEELDESYIEGVAISLKPKKNDKDVTEKGQEELAAEKLRDEERFAQRQLQEEPKIVVEKPKLEQDLVSLDGKALISQNGDILKMQFLAEDGNALNGKLIDRTFTGGNVLGFTDGTSPELWFDTSNLNTGGNP